MPPRKKMVKDSWHSVFAALVLVPKNCDTTISFADRRTQRELYEQHVKNGLPTPHLLLISDYTNGRLKLPGGKVEQKHLTKAEGKLSEALTIAISDELQEEAGVKYEWAQFGDEERVYTCTLEKKGGVIHNHYFLKIIQVDEKNPLEWKPALRPGHVGEATGVVWMPIQNRRDRYSFPFNRFDSVQQLGKSPGKPREHFINHDSIFYLCELMWKTVAPHEPFLALEACNFHGKYQSVLEFNRVNPNPAALIFADDLIERHGDGENEAGPDPSDTPTT